MLSVWRCIQIVLEMGSSGNHVPEIVSLDHTEQVQRCCVRRIDSQELLELVASIVALTKP
jgi:hypothetical protein